jgi:hypothetical protein
MEKLRDAEGEHFSAEAEGEHRSRMKEVQETVCSLGSAEVPFLAKLCVRFSSWRKYVWVSSSFLGRQAEKAVKEEEGDHPAEGEHFLHAEAEGSSRGVGGGCLSVRQCQRGCLSYMSV